jgi:hypothetical protein
MSLYGREPSRGVRGIVPESVVTTPKPVAKKSEPPRGYRGVTPGVAATTTAQPITEKSEPLRRIPETPPIRTSTTHQHRWKAINPLTEDTPLGTAQPQI